MPLPMRDGHMVCTPDETQYTQLYCVFKAKADQTMDQTYDLSTVVQLYSCTAVAHIVQLYQSNRL